MVAVVDYGAGNLHSVAKALAALNADVSITNDEDALALADKIILPGVGAFGDCMKNLTATGIVPALKKNIAAGKPLLGICVGLQVLFEGSEESPGVAGLGIFRGMVRRLPTQKLKVPHIGWNSLKFLREDEPLFRGLPEKTYVYFVHGYHAVPEDDKIISAATEYDGEITAAIRHDNVAATQFHPEKSGDAGLKILENFLREK